MNSETLISKNAWNEILGWKYTRLHHGRKKLPFWAVELKSDFKTITQLWYEYIKAPVKNWILNVKINDNIFTQEAQPSDNKGEWLKNQTFSCLIKRQRINHIYCNLSYLNSDFCRSWRSFNHHVAIPDDVSCFKNSVNIIFRHYENITTSWMSKT